MKPFETHLQSLLVVILICTILPFQAQNWEAFSPYDHPSNIPKAFLPETVKQRVLAEQPDIKQSLYEQFANDISGIATWNILKGKTHTALNEWQEYLEGQTKRFVYYQGDTMRYHLQIIRDPSINAYATAGGYVFIHIGLLAEARNMEEVLLVLGHELGHNFSQHAWEGYLDRHRASTTIMLTSLIGGMAGLVGKTAAISAYLSHSREDESEADQIAVELLQRAKIDLVKGAGIYRTFMQQEKNQRIRYGNSMRHWFYGSTHPAPAERYEQLMAQKQNDINLLDHEPFMAMRKTARMERLHLLLAEADYRTAIESAWRYLIEEPEEFGYEAMMFDALRRLRLTQEIPQDEMVLCYGYDTKGSLMAELIAEGTLSPESKSTLELILLIDDLNPTEQPFPLNSSFGSLYSNLKSKIEESADLEAQLLLALSEDKIDETRLTAYVSAGGRNADYAQWLIDRKHGVDNSKTILLPDQLALPSNEMYSGKDYKGFMEYYDWQPIIQRFEQDDHRIQVVRKDEVTQQTPYAWEMFERLEHLCLKPDLDRPADAAIVDPDLGNFMMDRNIGGFVSLSLAPRTKLIRCDLSVVHFPRNQAASKRTSSGNCIGMVNDRAYLSNQVLKRYRKLK